jgi:hypothetical protein
MFRAAWRPAFIGAKTHRAARFGRPDVKAQVQDDTFLEVHPAAGGASRAAHARGLRLGLVGVERLSRPDHPGD